jgi:DNA-binding NtrC family response regulator
MRAGVLFVSPHSEDADRLSQILGPVPVELDHVADLEHARRKLRQEPYPVILTDADLPDGIWSDVLDLAQHVSPSSRVIVTTRLADVRLWIDALGRGVFDLLAQPFYPKEVCRILANARARHAHDSHGLSGWAS